MPFFGPTDEEKEYTGDPDDRKALMAHRKKVLELTKAGDKARENWISAQRSEAGKVKSEAGKEVSSRS